MTLKKWLHESGGTQKNFALTLGISEEYLSYIVNGHKIPSPRLAERIEIATGGRVTAMELLFPHRAAPEAVEVIL